MNPLLHFIVPVREPVEDRLERALGSLYAQNDPSWVATVCTEQAVAPSSDERVRYFIGPLVETIATAMDEVQERWTAFLSSDAWLDARYVKWLKQYQGEWGCIIFRSLGSEGGVLPDRDMPSLDRYGVRLSLAVRTAVIAEYSDYLDPEDLTGIGLLNDIRKHDIRVYIHPETAHFVE